MTREEAIHYLNSTGWLEERERIAINFLDSIGCFEEHDRIMMPSADRPKGEWIVHDIVCREEICLPYECPNCGFRYSCRFNFCPNCGADMRGEEE